LNKDTLPQVPIGLDAKLGRVLRRWVRCAQGWPSTSLYFIKSGEVRVVRHLPANERVRRLLSNSVMAAQFQPGSPLRDR
jgi:hypothetical protein